MKHSAFLFVAALCAGVVSAHAANRDAVPAPIRADLDMRYPGWQLYNLDVMQPGERKYCFVPSGGGSLVEGDFNGDGNLDYGILIAKGKQGYALAYVKHGDGYKGYTLFPAKPGDTGSAGLLSIAGRGSVSKYDGVMLVFCESSRPIYVFKHKKFVPIFGDD